LKTDYNQTKVSPDQKHGEDSMIFFGIFNYSIALNSVDARSAAQEAGISEISYMDYEVLSILTVFTKMTLHVYGD
jgi:hypothetical protein